METQLANIDKLYQIKGWFVWIKLPDKAEVSNIGENYKKSMAYGNVSEMNKRHERLKLWGASRNEQVVVELNCQWNDTRESVHN